MGSSNRLSQTKPGPVNTGGKGIDTKELDRPELVQCFHQYQRNPTDNGGTRQWQGNALEHAPRAEAQSATDIKCAYRLLHEGGTGEQVNVGIKHHGYQQ